MAARAVIDPRAKGWECRQVPTAFASPARTGEAAPEDRPHVADGMSTLTAGASHPPPVATSTAVAAGILLAVAALAAGVAAIGLGACITLLAAGGEKLQLGRGGAIVLAVAFACVNAATVIAAGRGARPVTVFLVLVLSCAWPLSGLPLPAAALATVAMGLAIARDRRSSDGRVSGWVPIAALATPAAVLTVVALAGASVHHRSPAPRPQTPGLLPAGQPAANAPADSTPLTGDVPPTDATPKTTPPTDATPETISPTHGTTTKTPPTDATPKTTPPTGATSKTTPLTGAPATTLGEGATNPIAPTGDAPKTDGVPKTTAHGNGAPKPGEPVAGEGETAVPPTSGAPKTGAAGDAAAFVRSYYAALDARRYEDAWKRLSPALKTRFGGYAKWRAGYGATLSSRPSAIKSSVAPDGSTTVEHVLVARDRAACGPPVEQSFAVTWRLMRSGAGWSVGDLRATARGGKPARPACG
jgi:hypothetical protein